MSDAAPMAHEATLEDALEVLLRGVPANSVVSWSAVRAVHAAHAAQLPGIASIAATWDVELRGSEFVTGAAPIDAGPERHDAVAAAISVGATRLVDALPELVRHAARGSEVALDIALVATRIAQRDVSTDTITQLLVELDGSAARSYTHAALLERIASMAADLDDARGFELLERARGAYAKLPGTIQVTTRLAYQSSWLAPGDVADDLLGVVRDAPSDVAPGWSQRARALDCVFEDDLDGSIPLGRRAALGAVLERDADLESHSLLGIAMALAARGNLDDAIQVQERSLARAHDAANWRVAAIGFANLASMQVETLAIGEARRNVGRLLDLVDTRQLRAHRFESLLHAARTSYLAGDLPAAARELDRAIAMADAAPEGNVGDFDATYRAIRVAELCAWIGTTDAAERCRTAREAWSVDRLGDQELELLLAEFEADPALASDAASVAAIVPLMRSGEPVQDANALTWLARRASIEQDPGMLEVLEAAIEATEPGRAPILDLALDEAIAARRRDDERWRALADIADRWRNHGFPLDAALVGAAAGIAAADAGAGADAARLLDEAHRSLAQLGSSRHVRRLRDARRRAESVGPSRATLAGAGSATALDRSTFDAIRSAAVERTLRPGELLPSDVVGIVETGTMRIEASVWSGDPSLIGLAGAGSVLGLHRAFDDRPAAFERYVAISACRISVVPVDALASRATVAVDLAHAAAREATLVARRLARALDLRHGADLDRRIGHALLDLSTGADVEVRDGVTVLPAVVTRELVGELVATSREAASRSMSRLVEAGLLERVGRRVGIPDLDALRRWVDAAVHG